MKTLVKPVVLAVAAAALIAGGLVTGASAQSRMGIESCITAPSNWSGGYGMQSYGPAQYNSCVSDREAGTES